MNKLHHKIYQFILCKKDMRKIKEGEDADEQ